ncbi:glycosyltransferase [Aestuariispira insulae]|uniref:Spore protein YkvP/CgeB glycosyl transferase-like domain-containing protein n=1 Tax=Aestuariispira insulae TaxID=1461337 RepID=A0A3D9HF78_9PROT|nr:glycosyltransferase [Aestuariispira insulae]RED48134.1 hypothetical protein DFP90_108153 [Aestuariispira insulae]
MIGIGFLCHAENDNVNEMARQMADGFLAEGVDYRLIDTRQSGAGQELLDLIRETDGNCFLNCFNNVGLPTAGDSPVLDAINDAFIPVYSWYLDHPIINAPEFNIPVKNHIITQTSPLHVEFLEKYPIHDGRPLYTLPHAVNVSDNFSWDQEKTIPCLFVGTIGAHPDEQRNQWAGQYGERVAENLNRMVELYLGGLPGGLENYLLKGLDQQEKERLDWPLLRSYAIVLDRYLRDRMKLIMAQLCLDVGGLVAGPGFDALLSAGTADQFPGAVPADQVPALVHQSRLMMSPQPEYYQSHERFFFAAAGSAVPITGQQDYPAQWLDQGVVKVDYRDPSGNRDRLMAALQDEDLLAQKALDAYSAVRERHQYQNRALEILRHLAEVSH